MPPILSSQDKPVFQVIQDVHNTLHNQGCRMCDLGFQEELNGCCVSRGTFNTKKMIVGEAPGRFEDAQGAPFTGPAGLLMDRIWESVGLSTNDWYLTNVVKCRPIAEKGSGKENFTPKKEQRDQCFSYLSSEFRLLKPRIVVTVGAIATAKIMGAADISIGRMRGLGPISAPWPPGGRSSITHEFLLFPMLHPAALLHTQGQPERHRLYRQQMWDDIRKLKTILEQKDLL